MGGALETVFEHLPSKQRYITTNEKAVVGAAECVQLPADAHSRGAPFTLIPMLTVPPGAVQWRNPAISQITIEKSS